MVNEMTKTVIVSLRVTMKVTEANDCRIRRDAMIALGKIEELLRDQPSVEEPSLTIDKIRVYGEKKEPIKLGPW